MHQLGLAVVINQRQVLQELAADFVGRAIPTRTSLQHEDASIRQCPRQFGQQ
jgi:hypothetical protein